MSDRSRRAVLALGAGILGSMAGCTGLGGEAPRPSPDDPSSTPDSGPADTPADTQIEAAHLSFNHADALHRIDAGFAQRDVANYYLALLTSSNHETVFRTDRFTNHEAKTFVTDTDFSQSALIVFQDRRSSSHPDLEFRQATRAGETVTITAAYPGNGATADITTDTLLVRVPADERAVNAASARIIPQHGDPVQVSTLNVYEDGSAFDAAGDLVIRNRDCATAPLSVTVTYEGELFLREGVELQPASLRRIEGLFAYPGTWTVAVKLGSETRSRSWSLTGETPGDVLIDVTGDGAVTLSHQASGVDETSLDSCETTDYPYESSEPAQNLDRPVDLLVLDQSADNHHLTVQIRDGDTDVYSGEFDTREGYDKAKRAGLLAKKTTYTVDVTLDNEPTVSESVTLQEGVKKLEVRVTESGGVEVSLE